MKMKGFVWAVLAATVLGYVLDSVYYMTMADMEKMMEPFKGIAYTKETMPNPAWYILYELARALAVGLVVLQRPMQGMTAALWGASITFIVFFVSTFGWVMTFPMLSLDGNVLMEAIVCVATGAIMGWIIGFVYSKMS